MDGPPHLLVGAGASLPLCSTAFHLTLFIVFMYMSVSFVCMYVYHMHAVTTEAQKASDPQEMKLQ